jgi:outer membrane receptor for ferrienterochelin and colicin
MGALAVPLFIGGIGLQVAGTIQTAQAEKAAGEQAAAEAQFQAQLAEREAKSIEQRTQYEQQKQAQASARGMSTLQAGLGASGVVTTAGAPLLLQAKQASEYELENLMIGWQGTEEATMARTQASWQRRRAGYEKSAGKAVAGTTLLTGLGGAGMTAGATFYKPSTSYGFGKGQGALQGQTLGQARKSAYGWMGW